MAAETSRPVANAVDLIGRLFLVVLFIVSGIGKIAAYVDTAGFMQANGVPAFLLPLVILVEIGGGALVLIGWHTRIAAFIMAGFTILALLLFHLPVEDQNVVFAELGGAGGFLLLAARGPAGWSVDALFGSHRQRSASRSRGSA